MCSLEGLMLKLKLQYFGHLIRRVNSLEKTLMPGGIGGRRRRGRQRMRWWMASPTRWTWVWVTSGSWWWTGTPGMLQFMGSQRVGHNWATELNWADRTLSGQILIRNQYESDIIKHSCILFLSFPFEEGNNSGRTESLWNFFSSLYSGEVSTHV